MEAQTEDEGQKTSIYGIREINWACTVMTRYTVQRCVGDGS